MSHTQILIILAAIFLAFAFGRKQFMRLIGSHNNEGLVPLRKVDAPVLVGNFDKHGPDVDGQGVFMSREGAFSGTMGAK
jgi:hypothetical protein